MKRRVFIIFLMSLFAFTFTSCSSSMTGSTTGASNSSSNNQNSAISIKNFSFTPSVLTVKAGTTVVWTNNDIVTHSIKSTDFSSPNFKNGETFEYKFEKAGTYDYHCGIHLTMTGKIIVV